MEFEDLSQYDIELIKSLALGLLTNTKMNCRYEALTEETLACIYGKGFKIEPYPGKLSIAISNDLKSKGHNRTWAASEVVKEIFQVLKSLNVVITKDETREATWKNPGPKWYTPYANYKKPWVIF